MNLMLEILATAWRLLEQSSLSILLGLLIGGLLKVFLSAEYVASHLGKGTVKPVLKAALLGVPIPLCSCGVLPAAAQLQKQGANRGATTAFLIATPESGVDSIAVSWALLDPLMTVARPVTAFVSATVAGVLENLLSRSETKPSPPPLPMANVDAGCNAGGCGCDHAPISVGGTTGRVWRGVRSAMVDIWNDLAGWFLVGIVVAALITALVPEDLMTRHLGGGIGSMLLMLVAGIPMYICATASTPIAAALILKGVSPGAALVFLLAGPATNVATLSVLVPILGKRGVVVYLATISCVSVLCGLLVDSMYLALGLSAAATIGTVTEIMPEWLMIAGVGVLVLMSLPVVVHRLLPHHS